MRRLNIKERRKTTNSRFLVAFYYAVIFYNEGSPGRRHALLLYFIFLSIAALILFQLVIGASRMWQKLAGSFLLIAYSVSFLGFGLEPHMARTVAMGFWWAAVGLVSLDWILEHFIKPVPVTTAGILIDVPKITEPHLPADEARDFVLTRMSAEADAEKSPLTALQLQFLDYSRIASDEDAKAVEQEFYKQENYWEFKKHVINLFTVAIKKDRAEDPAAYKKYRCLLSDLKKGKRDQQLASLLDDAMLNARTDGEKFQDYFLYIVIGIAAVALFLVVMVSLP